MSLKQPVRYPVKYYSHTDTDAPQLADADGVIKTILKACLVTGYGDGADAKAGAGWTSVYEDAFRIVLRRPLRTGNPPDLKIEDGVINGAASHRIVSYAFDSCTGLDDPNSITSAPLLDDENKLQQWHLIASDFGFVLCVQLTDNSNGPRFYTFLCCELPHLDTSKSAVFCVNKARESGKLSRPLQYQNFVDLKTGALVHDATTSAVMAQIYLDVPIALNDVYPMSDSYLRSGYRLPFMRAVSNDTSDTNTRFVTADQSYLYWPDLMNGGYYSPRICFIPTDYWVL